MDEAAIETLDVGERVLTTDWRYAVDPFGNKFSAYVSITVFEHDGSPTKVDPQAWRLVELAFETVSCSSTVQL